MPFGRSDFESKSTGEFVDALVAALNMLESGVGGGGGVSLVETILVPAGAPVDTVTFSDLDGDADGEYLVRGTWDYPQIASNARLIVKPNGITTNQKTGWGTGGAATENGNLARLVLAPQPGSGINSAKFEASLDARSGEHDRQLIFGGGSGDSIGGLLTVNFRSYHGYGMWAETATNITSLVLEVVTVSGSPIAGGIGAGSRFSLYRVDA